MSFKLFVYYCAVCGAWFGLLGWLAGRWLAPEGTDAFARTVLRGLSLGMFVALGLGLVDALWNLSSRKYFSVLARGLFVALIGGFSGLVGGAVGHALFRVTGRDWLIPIGWLLTGLLIGASVGGCEMVARLAQGQNPSGATRKVLNGVVGGSLGGLLGGIVYLNLGTGLSHLFQRSTEEIFSSLAWGFTALGACIGLFIGLAQVILKEAWIRVEAGFRPGRDLILSKEVTTLGRGESCDLGLFGDPGIEKMHARIVLRDKRYHLEDGDTPGGTYLNDRRIAQTTRLRSGDAIQIGQSVLRFKERQKEP
jgi:hypothetical protein